MNHGQALDAAIVAAGLDPRNPAVREAWQAGIEKYLEVAPSIDRARAADAAVTANHRYGQWMPEHWLHLFLDAYEGKR